MKNGDGSITIHAAAAPWQHIRQIGEDVCAGEMILPSHMTVSPPAIGAMIAGGVLEIEVIRKPVVRIIPTADEIIPPCTDPKPGDILEFNGSIFSAMVRSWGAEAVVYPIVPDKFDQIKEMVANIAQANILMFAGGFSAADEPDGSAKFIVNILLNEQVKSAIDGFIARGGLILGICNGFQALVKSGLLPYGQFDSLTEESPTLFYNDANQHVAKMVETRIANTNSPWLTGVQVGDIHTIPVSHGEGKFVVSETELADLIANGQIITQYVDFQGKPSMDSFYNPNGSVAAIGGIISKNGQILGKMGHSERYESGLFKNIPGHKDQQLFESAVAYFRGE